MKRAGKKKGASLIIVLMVLAVAIIFSSVTLTTISRTTKLNFKEKKSEDVLFSAESGLEYGIAWFNKNKTSGTVVVPPINDCIFDVKVEPDGNNYKIISKATLGELSKTVSIRINKIETPATGGGGITVGSPFGIIVPVLNNVRLSTEDNKINDIRNVLTYQEGNKIYNLFRTYWPKEQVITNTGQYNGTIKVNYHKVTSPSIAIKIENTNVQFESLTKKQLKQKNVSNNNTTIYTVENGTGYKLINGIMYVDGDLKITSEYNQSIDQDLSKMGIKKIIVKGIINIIASGNVSLNNFNIEGKSFINNSQNSLNINSSYISCLEEINTYSRSGLNITSSTLQSKNIKINEGNYINIDNTSINTEDLNLQSNSTLSVQNSLIKSTIMNINNKNEFKLISSTINSENIIISTSTTIFMKSSKIESKKISSKNANNINLQDYTEIISEDIDFVCNAINIIGDTTNSSKGYTKIITNNFNVNSGKNTFYMQKAIVIADSSTISSNSMNINYSGFLVKKLNLNSADMTTLNQSSLISDLVNFYNTRVVNINNNGLDKSEFDNIINEINKYLSGSSIPGTIKYEIDKPSLKYE